MRDHSLTRFWAQSWNKRDPICALAHRAPSFDVREDRTIGDEIGIVGRKGDPDRDYGNPSPPGLGHGPCHPRDERIAVRGLCREPLSDDPIGKDDILLIVDGKKSGIGHFCTKLAEVYPVN